MDMQMATVVPAPDPIAAPVAAVAALASPAVAGNVDNGTHSYKVTFTTDAGGETEAGAASNIVTVANKAVNGKVTLTGIPVSSDTLVTGRKIYRTVAGNAGNYKLAATLADNTTTTATDNLADVGLGANAPALNTAGGRALDGAKTLAGAALVADGGGAATAILRETDGAGRILCQLAALTDETDHSYVPVQFVGPIHVVLTGGPTCLLFVD